MDVRRSSGASAGAHRLSADYVGPEVEKHNFSQAIRRAARETEPSGFRKADLREGDNAQAVAASFNQGGATAAFVRGRRNFVAGEIRSDLLAGSGSERTQSRLNTRRFSEHSILEEDTDPGNSEQRSEQTYRESLPGIGTLTVNLGQSIGTGNAPVSAQADGDATAKLPSGRELREFEGKAYLFMREVVGRPIKEPYLSALANANESIRQTRSVLSFGRGNTETDLRHTNGESWVRKNQERRLTNKYVMTSVTAGSSVIESGKLAATATAAFSQITKATNCGGHAAVGAYAYLLRQPSTTRSPSVVTVRPKDKGEDHNWFEVRFPPKWRTDTRIVGDAWAEGPAVMSEDSAFAADAGKLKILYRWQEDDPQRVDELKAKFSDLEPDINNKVNEKMASDTAKPSGRIYKEISVISKSFAREAQSALKNEHALLTNPDIIKEVYRMIAAALRSDD